MEIEIEGEKKEVLLTLKGRIVETRKKTQVDVYFNKISNTEFLKIMKKCFNLNKLILQTENVDMAFKEGVSILDFAKVLLEDLIKDKETDQSYLFDDIEFNEDFWKLIRKAGEYLLSLTGLTKK